MSNQRYFWFPTGAPCSTKLPKSALCDALIVDKMCKNVFSRCTKLVWSQTELQSLFWTGLILFCSWTNVQLWGRIRSKVQTSPSNCLFHRTDRTSLPRCDPSGAVAYFNNFLYTVYKTHNSSLFTLSLPLFVPILPPHLILSQPFHHDQPAAGSPSILPLAAHLFVFRRNVNDSDSGCGVWRWNLLKRDRAVMDCECAIVCLRWVCWGGWHHPPPGVLRGDETPAGWRFGILDTNSFYCLLTSCPGVLLSLSPLLGNWLVIVSESESKWGEADSGSQRFAATSPLWFPMNCCMSFQHLYLLSRHCYFLKDMISLRCVIPFVSCELFQHSTNYLI